MITEDEERERQKLWFSFVSELRRGTRSDAARKIQGIWGDYLLFRAYKRMAVKMTQGKDTTAATKIQSCWRGKQARSLVRVIRLQLDMSSELRVMPRMRVMLQEKKARMAFLQEESEFRLARLWMNYISSESIYRDGLSSVLSLLVAEAFKRFTSVGISCIVPVRLMANDETSDRLKKTAEARVPYRRWMVQAEQYDRFARSLHCFSNLLEHKETFRRERLNIRWRLLLREEWATLSVVATKSHVKRVIIELKQLSCELFFERTELLKRTWEEMEQCRRSSHELTETHGRSQLSLLKNEAFARAEAKSDMLAESVSLLCYAQHLGSSSIGVHEDILMVHIVELDKRVAVGRMQQTMFTACFVIFEDLHRQHCEELWCHDVRLLSTINYEAQARDAINSEGLDIRELIATLEMVVRMQHANEEETTMQCLKEAVAREFVALEEAHALRRLHVADERDIRSQHDDEAARCHALWKVETSELRLRSTMPSSIELSYFEAYEQMRRFHLQMYGEADAVALIECCDRSLLLASYQDVATLWGRYCSDQLRELEVVALHASLSLQEQENKTSNILYDSMSAVYSVLTGQSVAKWVPIGDELLCVLEEKEKRERKQMVLQEYSLWSLLESMFKKKGYENKKKKNVMSRLLRAHREDFEKKTFNWILQTEHEERRKLEENERSERGELKQPQFVVVCKLPELLSVAAEDGQYCASLLEAINSLPVETDRVIFNFEEQQRWSVEHSSEFSLLTIDEGFERCLEESAQQSALHALEAAKLWGCEKAARCELCGVQEQDLETALASEAFTMVLITETGKRLGLQQAEQHSFQELTSIMQQEAFFVKQRDEAGIVVQQFQKRAIAKRKINKLRHTRDIEEARDSRAEQLLLETPVIIKKEAAKRMCLETEESVCLAKLLNRASQEAACVRLQALPPLSSTRHVPDMTAPREAVPALPSIRPPSPFLLKELLLALRSLATFEKPRRRAIREQESKALGRLWMSFNKSRPNPRLKTPKLVKAKVNMQPEEIVTLEMKRRLVLENAEHDTWQDHVMQWRMQHMLLCWKFNSSNYAADAIPNMLGDLSKWITVQKLPERYELSDSYPSQPRAVHPAALEGSYTF